METTINKWGNSLAIRLPAEYAKEIHAGNGTHVNIRTERNKIIITPVRKKYILKNMLNEITTSNLHESVDTGEKIGNEVW